MLTLISFSLCLMSLINGKTLIRRLQAFDGEYEGERIRIAVSNSEFKTYEDCKTTFESQESNGFSFGGGWDDSDYLYYCIFSLDCDDCRNDKSWKSESNDIIFYDSAHVNSVKQTGAYSLRMFGGITYKKELSTIYRMQKDMSSKQFTIEFVRRNNGDLITSVTYEIFQPVSRVMDIAVLDYKPTRKTCDSSNSVISSSSSDMGMHSGDVYYVCATFRWNLIGGSSHVEIGYLDSNDYTKLDITSKNPRNGLTSIRYDDFDYLELSYDDVKSLSGESFVVKAIMTNDAAFDSDLASDEDELGFQIYVSMA